ncbi:PEP-CTERM sorting domain-containing protein [Duganella callida]|uniref:PEP-CTERM sorting domain-containing protein n=2 Tax=Duganella callida TaxID=2561932 RepID=A0A4Y9SR66_9BURK|nr:PEP-CTERM sorting domain-containing protein [Duganella callida]
MFKNGSWSPGVVLPWIVQSGDGYLLLAKTASLPGQPFADGPHVQTNFGTVGDFVATVTTDSAYNGGGGAGFFMDSQSGYTGIGFGTNWVSDSAGDGYVANGYHASATSQLTLQIKRVGDTLTKSYKLAGQSDFTLISSLTDSATVPGWVIFDLTNYSDVPGAVMFTSFSIAAVPEPQTWAMLAGGLAALGVLRRRQQRS